MGALFGQKKPSQMAARQQAYMDAQQAAQANAAQNGFAASQAALNAAQASSTASLVSSRDLLLGDQKKQQGAFFGAPNTFLGNGSGKSNTYLGN